MERQASNARPVVYDVSVDEADLKVEPAGPLFERHSVGLVGRIDHRWVECYRRLTTDGSYFSGFHLEPAAARVSFVCHRSNGPSASATMMTRLRELAERANQAATLSTPAAPRAAVEQARDEKPAAGALFSRLGRGRF